MTSSTKPEIHNVWQRCQRKTDWPLVVEKWKVWTCGSMSADTLITILISPTRGAITRMHEYGSDDRIWYWNFKLLSFTNFSNSRWHIIEITKVTSITKQCENFLTWNAMPPRWSRTCRTALKRWINMLSGWKRKLPSRISLETAAIRQPRQSNCY